MRTYCAVREFTAITKPGYDNGSCSRVSNFSSLDWITISMFGESCMPGDSAARPKKCARDTKAGESCGHVLRMACSALVLLQSVWTLWRDYVYFVFPQGSAPVCSELLEIDVDSGQPQFPPLYALSVLFWAQLRGLPAPVQASHLETTPRFPSIASAENAGRQAF